MMIHAALYAQTLQRMSGDIPHVLTGDFNFKPMDAPYHLITSGYLRVCGLFQQDSLTQ